MVGDRIYDGQYEVTIHAKGIPYLEPEPEEKAELLEIGDVMSMALVCVPLKVS